jgi:colanic acid biosynthesis glycosyl transferase WcaI
MYNREVSKKKVWVISELYYPEETSTGAFLTQTAEGLARRFLVRVLCSQPTYGARGQRAPVNEVRNGVKVHRCWGTTFNKDVLPLRLLNMFTITLSIMLNAVGRIQAGDCVLVVTNPPLLPLVVALACFIRRAKCVLIIHDVYPDVLIATGALSSGSSLAGMIAWIMRVLYRRMASIVVLGRDMETLVRSKLPNGVDWIVTIPNWADLDLVNPLPRSENALLGQFGLANKFVIQYSGNIGRTHGIEYLTQCAEQMRNGSALHFLFIGFGGKKAWLKKAVEDRGLKNVSILDYRLRSELPQSLNACDVAIVSLARGMTGVSVPSRMYNIMAAGKPIIAVADAASELAQVIRDENIGWVVEPGNVEALKAAIDEAMGNPGRLIQMGLRARKAAEAKYSLEHAIASYMNLVCSLYPPTR